MDAVVSRPPASGGLVIWASLSVVFWVALGWAASASTAASAEVVLYQSVLFPLCTFPALVLARQPRYRLLAFFMLVYYAMFGLLDLVLMFVRQHYQIYTGTNIERTAFADQIIIGGAVLVLAGYAGIAGLSAGRRPSAPASWGYAPSLIVGVTLWAIGIGANFVVQFVYVNEAQKHVGLASVTISNLYYLAFLGDAMLVVTAFRNRGRRTPWLIIAFMLTVEYVFGFVGNIKEVSYRLPVLILICSFFSRGRISLKLPLLIAVSFVPYQALFNVYREQVLQVYHRSALAAAGDAARSAATVVGRFERQRDSLAKSVFITLDRIDGRKYVEVITQRTGVSVPFQEGETFKFLAYSFVPAFWWPDKPQLSTGQLMNRTFHMSLSRQTFVPSTILGEFYWNFGISGVIWGMLAVGVIFGLINCRFLPDERYTTAGMLAVLVAAYFLAVRFEASVASQYGQCLRVLLLLAALDSGFALLGWKIAAGGRAASRQVRGNVPRLTYVADAGPG